MNDKPKSQPTHEIFHVTGEGNSSRWTRIGAAWEHKDGKGNNLSLNYLPLEANARIVMREYEPKAKTETEARS